MTKIKISPVEIMCYAGSQAINNGDRVFVGIGYPVVSAALAKKFHAPDCTLIMEGGIYGIEPFRPPEHIADLTCSKGAEYCCDFADVFMGILYKGFIDVGFLGAGQVDRYGNINSTAVGDYYNPDTRLTGSGGAHEIGSFSQRTVITLTGGSFLEKVDYVTTPGYLQGYESRYEAGLPEDTGPEYVISTKGVFRFDKTTKEIYLASYHPGVSIEEIKNDIPWNLQVASDIRVTPLPSAEQLNFMRGFAPTISLGSQFSLNVMIRNIMQLMQARQN
ncbi:MAG: CoA-transferase [Chloroflexota bacterium]|nr:CoA-transferase [Chloroflexota bacterium]